MTARSPLKLVSSLMLLSILLHANDQHKPIGLTNADIVRMAQIGDTDTELVSYIERHRSSFVFDQTSLQQLSKAGVSVNVVKAMMESLYVRHGAPKAAEQANRPEPPQGSIPPPPVISGGGGSPPPTSIGPLSAQAAADTADADKLRTDATAAQMSPPVFTRAVCPLRPTPTGISMGLREMDLDWSAVSTHEVFYNSDYLFKVRGVNDLLYQYELTVTLNSAYSADNLDALAKALKPAPTPTPGRQLSGGCALDQHYSDAKSKAAALQTGIAAMQPAKQSDGKYISIPVCHTLSQWDVIKSQNVAPYVQSLQVLQSDLRGNACKTSDAPDLITNASQLIADYGATVRPNLQSIDQVANGDHIVSGQGYLDRTRGGSVVVRETVGGTDTAASPKTFPLEATYGVVTVSGGFLLTTLQARTYSSQNAPPGGPGGPTTVLSVGGQSGVRPALTALLNIHDPFQWALNRPNFGFALSAGPVIEVANGQAETSKLGFFGGLSFHISKQVFITPGVHVGEFAGFPQGLTANGQSIPANFGALVPTKRYTARFAFAITFRGKNPTSLLGTGGTPKGSSQPAGAGSSTSGPKQ